MLSPTCGKHRNDFGKGRAQNLRQTCKAWDRRQTFQQSKTIDSLLLAPMPIQTLLQHNSDPLVTRCRLYRCLCVTSQTQSGKIKHLQVWLRFNLTNGWEPCATSKSLHGRLPVLHSTWLLQETRALTRCILMCQPSGHLEAVRHRTEVSFVIWIPKDALKDMKWSSLVLQSMVPDVELHNAPQSLDKGWIRQIFEKKLCKFHATVWHSGPPEHRTVISPWWPSTASAPGGEESVNGLTPTTRKAYSSILHCLKFRCGSVKRATPWICFKDDY